MMTDFQLTTVYDSISNNRGVGDAEAESYLPVKSQLPYSFVSRRSSWWGSYSGLALSTCEFGLVITRQRAGLEHVQIRAGDNEGHRQISRVEYFAMRFLAFENRRRMRFLVFYSLL